MEDNIKKLKTEFYKIQCKNWIENTEKGTSAAGKILENLLGLSVNYKLAVSKL